MGVVYPGRFCSLLTDESLLPREIAVGGVGTCRLDWSDIGVERVVVWMERRDGECGECGERKEGTGLLFIYLDPLIRQGKWRAE